MNLRTFNLQILWLVSFVSLACFCNVVQLNSFLFVLKFIRLEMELAEFDSWKKEIIFVNTTFAEIVANPSLQV